MSERPLANGPGNISVRYLPSLGGGATLSRTSSSTYVTKAQVAVGAVAAHAPTFPCALVTLSLLLQPIRTEPGKPSFFLPLPFLGTASGQFLRPAASRVLLSRFLLNPAGPSHKAPARLGSRGLSLLGASGKWGKKKEKNSCLTYMLSGIGFRKWFARRRLSH